MNNRTTERKTIMRAVKESIYTIDDIYALPDGQRAELIDGQIYNMAPPKRLHQKLISELTQSIGSYIKSQNGSCEVYPAPFAVFLNDDDKNYVEPDLSVICDKSKLDDRGCNGAPDLIIEVVSPSSRKLDYSIKNALYMEAGVREYWIIDPTKERTTVYYYEDDAAPMIYPFSAFIEVNIFPELYILIADFLD